MHNNAIVSTHEKSVYYPLVHVPDYGTNDNYGDITNDAI